MLGAHTRRRARRRTASGALDVRSDWSLPSSARGPGRRALDPAPAISAPGRFGARCACSSSCRYGVTRRRPSRPPGCGLVSLVAISNSRAICISRILRRATSVSTAEGGSGKTPRCRSREWLNWCGRRLEPPRVAPLAPQASASTNSAAAARIAPTKKTGAQQQRPCNKSMMGQGPRNGRLGGPESELALQRVRCAS